MVKIGTLLFVVSLLFVSKEIPQPRFSDDFDYDLSQWVIEMEAEGEVSIINGELDINVEKGCTIWFKQELKGSVRITFEAIMVDKGGEYDRVSDLNCFWMASDSNHANNFFADSLRHGIFKNYNSLQLYYVGLGGGNNTTTRFRRYPGNGKRPLLPQHDLSDSKYMLTPNQTMHIEMISDGEHVQYIRDGNILFDVQDRHPFTRGHFGFRTLTSHIKINNFKVYYDEN